MRTLWLSTLALALATSFAMPSLAADLGLQPDTPYALLGEESGSYLGIDTRDVTHERMVALKLNEERGVEITMVDQDAPAGKAGLREQDVILSFNGQPVEGVAELRRMIHETPPGRTVTLGVSRNGQMMTVKVQLADRRKLFHYPAIAAVPPMPPVPAAGLAPGAAMDIDVPMVPDFDVPSMDVIVHSSVRGGLMVENLTPQLGDFFGVKNGQGVLVRSVEKGSAAERAGFQAGDVIVRVGDRQVTDSSDWRNAMRRHGSGSVPISVLRNRKSVTLHFVVPRQTGKAIGFDPEVIADMGAFAIEMDNMRPQVERAQRQAREAQKEFLKHSEEFRKQAAQAAEEAQREVRSHQREIQEQAHRAAEEVQREMRLHRKDLERLQRQMEQWKRKAAEM